MSASESRIAVADLEQFDGRLSVLLDLVWESRGTLQFRRPGDAAASVDTCRQPPKFSFSCERWGRKRAPLMGPLTLALTGEDLDEIEIDIANAVGEVRRETRREREAAGG